MLGSKILFLIAATSNVVFAAYGCGEVNVVYTLVYPITDEQKLFLIWIYITEVFLVDINMWKSKVVILMWRRKTSRTTRVRCARQGTTFEVQSYSQSLETSLLTFTKGIWRGPEIEGSEFAENVKGVDWHAAGVGFGVRGSNMTDLTGLFEGNLCSCISVSGEIESLTN